jgi:integral membrane protein
VNQVFLRRLRILGTIEGVSTLVLFGIAMPLKYAAGMPMAVTIAGSIHGFLFLALVGMFAAGVRAIPISRRLAVAGALAAVVPFGPFVLDAKLRALGSGGKSGCGH